MATPITDLIVSFSSDNDWRGEFAKRWSLLAVYGDIGGTLALNADGEVFCLPHDDPGPPQREHEERWRLITLGQAGAEFPELAYLKPQRPPGAATCPACSGSGFGSMGDITYPCGRCNTMGWLPCADS